MSQQHNQQYDSIEAMDFLTPEQRFEAIAETLADIALSIVKPDHEQDQNL
jgi:hypothetical protein